MNCFGGYSYAYDGDGARVRKSIGSQGTLYWGSNLAESDLSGNITSEYIFLNGRRIARRDANGSVFYYLDDNIGSTSVIAKSDGTIDNESDMYPFGIEKPITTNLTDHFKYTGKERDTESGLDYFGARYYASSMGRWVSPDWAEKPEAVPYSSLDNPQSLNLYGYVKNNPLSQADPDGHCCVEEEEAVDETSMAAASEFGPAVGGAVKAIGYGGIGLKLTYDLLHDKVSDIIHPSTKVGQSDADEIAQRDANLRAQQPAPGTPIKPNPQDPTPPSPTGEHDKGARPSTKDKHEKVRPGTSPPPNYKPDRKFKQPKDDKKKDQKPPYVRKDRDKPAS